MAPKFSMSSVVDAVQGQQLIPLDKSFLADDLPRTFSWQNLPLKAIWV